jgi:hypothetical protein
MARPTGGEQLVDQSILNRRSWLVAAGRYAASALFASAASGLTTSDEEGSPAMPQLPENGLTPGRLPIWDYPERWWAKVARFDRLAHPEPREAVHLTTDDPKHETSLVATNLHSLWLGPQRLLHREAEEIHTRVKETFAFRQGSAWLRLQSAIVNMIRDFFPENGQSSGSVSILPMRRPAEQRGTQEPAVRITHPRAASFRPIYGRPPMIEIGDWRTEDVSFKGLYEFFAPAAGSSPQDNVLHEVFVHRRLDRNHASAQSPYAEYWFTNGCPGEDDARLKCGQIPALAANRYQGCLAKIRTSALLNLVKFDIGRGPDGKPDLAYTIMAVEFDPYDREAPGQLLSLRYASMPMSVALLNASPVEHLSVCAALQEVVQ